MLTRHAPRKMSSSVLTIASLFLLLVAGSQAASSCSATASLALRAGQGWTDSMGHNFSTYDLTVTNTGTCALSTVNLRLSLPAGSNVSQSWNLNASTDSSIFSLTNFGALEASSSFSGAGFILMASSPSASATLSVSVSSQNCSSCAGSGSSSSSSNSSSSNSSSSNSSSSNSSSSGTSSPLPGPVSSEQILSLITAPTELDREALLTDSQFVFDFTNAITGISKSEGGRTVAATRTNFPAIIGHGVAMTVGFIGPCGINLPHSHPRATEINFIVSGSFLAGFFQENGARFIGNTLQPGMATVFPRGAIHFELNLGCEPAMFVAAFNNEDPGVQTIASSFFGLPVDVVSVSLNISNIQTVEDLATHLPVNPAAAMAECMQRCGL